MLTGWWQQTQHPDSTRPTQGFHSNLQAQIHMALTHTLTRGTWLKMQHLDRLLTTDAISRQHKTYSRLSLKSRSTDTQTHKLLIHTLTWGVWLSKTQNLNRLLTTDATSRQYKTHSRLSLKSAGTHTCTSAATYTPLYKLSTYNYMGTKLEARLILL